MNLRQLELFVAVAESGSFSRGAETALLTQSTVSQHIAALEEEIGVRLFDRGGRGAELTVGGELFLQQTRRVLIEVAGLRQTMSHFVGLEQARLVIGASTVPGTYLIPRLLPQLALAYPGIRLELLCGDSHTTLARLVNGEIELAVTGHAEDLPGIDWAPLVDDPLVLVVGTAHPWHDRTGIALTELATLPLILREAGSGSGQTLIDAWQQAGRKADELTVAARLGSNEAVKEAVLAGFAAAFLSASAVSREVARGELAVIAVEGLTVTRSLWLATRSNRALSPAAQAFVNLLPR